MNIRPALLFLVPAFLVVAFTVFMINSYYGEETHTACEVIDKDRTSGEGSQMRVYTENCGTFVVSDSIIKTDFRSADRYAKIKVGKAYDITSYGWRIGFFSAFPKIITAETSDGSK